MSIARLKEVLAQVGADERVDPISFDDLKDALTEYRHMREIMLDCAVALNERTPGDAIARRLLNAARSADDE